MGRILKIGCGQYSYAEVNDEPGAGGANHSYTIYSKEENKPHAVLGQINFQNGPIKEAGVNGLMNEDLMLIVIDRLQGFQSGDYKCRENAIALTKMEEALLWLRKRTQDRIDRGVEGTSQK
jgi:hypothetical protein